MNLPRKDSEGTPYLSYSQIQLFQRDPAEYRKVYIWNEPFEGNEYTEFGSKVGSAIEKNDFSGFEPGEVEVLKKVTRLDQFEREVRLNYEGFYVKGFIDTNSLDLKKVLDYKTGGKGKDKQYREKNYWQVVIYALAIRQETGITPEYGGVEFITRNGNAFFDEPLTVAPVAPIKIQVDLSEENLKRVYWDVLRTSKNIERFYIDNL